MNWLTASDSEIARAEKRLRKIRDRLLVIGKSNRHHKEESVLRAERAEIMFGDQPLSVVLRKKRRRR